MKDINKVTLRGRIGNIKTFGRENNVASISLATTRSYQDKSGQWQDITTWHRIKAFAGNKSVPPFDSLTKGAVIYVQGELTTNKYTDKDGNERETVEIQAEDIAIVADGRATPPASTPRSDNYYTPRSGGPDDLPF